jgi:C-terminal processing protease CtpA/Prc
METGKYATITNGDILARSITQQIQDICHDDHLWVRYHAEPLPEHEGSLLQNEEKVAELKLNAKIKNYGVEKLERLSGNVGNIDIRYFFSPSWGSGDTAVAAMRFLANTNALIIDLRKCGGGNPGMVALISTYFFEGDPIHLNDIYWRGEDFTQQYWTLPYVPGPRYVDKPIYILTSSYTFSAGEEFSYNLKNLGRATLIGETTGGGAHPGSPFRLNDHFEAFIPLGRAINPITKDDWEGKGIVPDIQVNSEQALQVAYKNALEFIIGNYRGNDELPIIKMVDEARSALIDLEEESNHHQT